MTSSIHYKDILDLYNYYSPLKTNSDLADYLFSITHDSKYQTYNLDSIREDITELIYQYYPNETTIKAAFLEQLLFKTPSSVSGFETPVKSSRADLCKINNNSFAFEIKTDLDTLDRLDKQLIDYSSVFEYVYVVCSEKKLSKIIDSISENVGVYYYRKNRRGSYTFSLHRKATLSPHLSSEAQIEMLTCTERSELSKQLNSYSNSGPDTVNSFFKHALKERYHKRWDFLVKNKEQIYRIDYQFFFKNLVSPNLVYRD